ncbi:hypothetical protein KDJ56_17820 [Brevibacillus composti]|uniref:Ppx/GppA phosphatase N-terminal domain-containing protein n=1 Tax=Brevibacillus composti TaxID=2796470 RepID=A0A7T5EJF8_9BACL|nr:hypothetical protein [Brevibacillus composti]QQE73734.1 hypothetical protein JD108_17880 [Brevibacillus composti]QUO40817.1 hypothetical protein KDJ56_17820 [Brevibacillus composti]
MKRYIGVIDLGSNTARLVIYEQNERGLVYERDNIKRGLRLSGHLRDGALDEQGWEKTMACMRQFRDILTARQVSDVIGVATAAVRQAANGSELMGAIETKSPQPSPDLSYQQPGVFPERVRASEHSERDIRTCSILPTVRVLPTLSLCSAQKVVRPS